MEAKGRHARLADGGAAVLDQLGEVFVTVSGECPRVGQIARMDEKDRGAPGAVSVVAVAARALAQIEALRRRCWLGDRVRKQDQREDTANQEEQRRPEDDQEPPLSHGTSEYHAPPRAHA